MLHMKSLTDIELYFSSVYIQDVRMQEVYFIHETSFLGLILYYQQSNIEQKMRPSRYSFLNSLNCMTTFSLEIKTGQKLSYCEYMCVYIYPSTFLNSLSLNHVTQSHCPVCHFVTFLFFQFQVKLEFTCYIKLSYS